MMGFYTLYTEYIVFSQQDTVSFHISGEES